MADCRPAGSTTVIVGAGGGVLASTRQFFDQAIVLSHAIAGTIDHRGSKLCNPPLRVEPIRALGAIVSACVIAEKIRDGSPIGTIYDDRQTQRGRRIQRVLQFDIAGSLGPLEQLLCLLAVERLESLKSGDVKIFVEKYLATLRQEHAGYLDALRNNKLIPCGESEV